MLRLADVSKRYGSGRWVLNKVDMEVPPAQSVSVIGSNGSGKSTLLRLLAGISRPTRGRISGAPPVIGYVPDRFPASDAMNSLAYLVHIGRIRGLSTELARQRAQQLLDRLQLVGGVRTPIRALSKGNAQKVALSQAVIVPPQLLILDEPWSGLDANAHDALADIMDEVVRGGGSVVFTDHRESISGAYATLTYRLEEGRVRSYEQAPSRVGVPMAHVVLADPGEEHPAPRRIDWREVNGVAEVRNTDRAIHVGVDPGACDDLLMIALRSGWSVVEVRRDPASGRHGTGARWAR